MSTQETEWIKDAKETVACTFANFDLFNLVDQISVSFNGRFTCRAGDANYSKKRIRLSSPLWPRMTEQDRYETIVHESCHIVVHHQSRNLPFYSPKAHGQEWKRAMRKCALKPERTHNIDRTGLRQVKQRIQAFCNCDVPHEITLNRATRIKKGSIYYCIKCNSLLRLQGKIPSWGLGTRFLNMFESERNVSP